MIFPLLCRIQYGFGQFNLGDSQTFYLLYEPNSFSMKIIIAQLDKDIQMEKQKKASQLFLQLMVYLEESIISVIDLYIPSAQYPVLHVHCPICDSPNPHIMVGCVDKISLNIPPLFCAQHGPQKRLPLTSYLPFGDTLKQQEIGKLIYQFRFVI